MIVEATVLYHATNTDPRDPNGLRSEKRLFNLDTVGIITPTADGKGRTIFHMRQPSAQPFFVVLEPYEYWAQILTTAQPRARLEAVSQ
jgi:hypothetical protein